MYNFITSLLVACTILTSTPISLTQASTTNNIFSTNLYDVAQKIGSGIVNAVDDVFDVADSWVTHASQLLNTPSVNYNDTYQTISNDYITQKIYNSNTVNNTTNYRMVQNNYTYNPITNTYNTHNEYKTYNNYTYYEDNNYQYITNNNITNYEYLIVNKLDVNDCKYYSYYFTLPNGSNSYNLTKEDVLGQYMIYNLYKYSSASDNPNLLGLWHLDGNYESEVPSNYTFNYNSVSWVNGKFDGGIKMDGTIDMSIHSNEIGSSMPNQYTVEFWFYNNVNNGTYNGCGEPLTWIHCAYTYDNGTQRVWFNGVENTKSSVPLLGYIKSNGSSTGGTGIYSNPYRYPYKSYNFTVPDSGSYSHPPYYYYDYINATYPSSINSAPLKFSDFNSTGITGYNPNDPYHYAPQLTDSGVYFAFSSYNNRPTNITIVGDTSYGVLAYLTKTVNNFDLRDCIMDEIRLSNGLLYTTSTFSPPSQAFSSGSIFVAPTGVDFKIGDVALQTTITPSGTYRIGGADYSYPNDGDVYVGLDSSVGVYAKIYYNCTWFPCDFGVWNGTEWQNGVGFNFSTLTWGSNSANVNIEFITNYFGDGSQEMETTTSTISTLIKFVPWLIDMLLFFLPIPLGLKALLISIVTFIGALITIKFIKK